MQKKNENHSSLYAFVSMHDTHIEVRLADRFFNGGTLCASHGKNLSSWITKPATLITLLKLAKRLHLRDGKEVDWQREGVNIANLQVRFPQLIELSKGKNSGTWLHPDLAEPLFNWLHGKDEDDESAIPKPFKIYQLPLKQFYWETDKVCFNIRTYDGFVNGDFALHSSGGSLSVRKWLLRRDTQLFIAELDFSLSERDILPKKYNPPSIANKFLPMLACQYPQLIEVWGDEDFNTQEVWLDRRLAISLARETNYEAYYRLLEFFDSWQPEPEENELDAVVPQVLTPNNNILLQVTDEMAAPVSPFYIKPENDASDDASSEIVQDMPQVQTYKAKREVTKYAGVDLELFQIPSGEYYASFTSATEPIEKPARSIFDFLGSKYLKSLLGKSFEFSEIAEMTVSGSNKPIKAVPLKVVAVYWYRQAELNNQNAKALVRAMVVESLTQVADKVFGINKTPAEQEDRLSATVKELQERYKPVDLESLSPDAVMSNFEEVAIGMLLQFATEYIKRSQHQISNSANGSTARHLSN